MRPRLRESENKKFVSISVACSPRERELITRKAIAANKSVSKFIIDIMMRKLGYERRTAGRMEKAA